MEEAYCCVHAAAAPSSMLTLCAYTLYNVLLLLHVDASVCIPRCECFTDRCACHHRISDWCEYENHDRFFI